ncbi:MAG: DUF6089 family protein, partial [Lentimicrobiaceae bacterium]|nr:DUF6089 family protein [Lentimicrobiaceae bacterium]
PKGVFKGSRPAGGLIYRYNINPRFAFKAAVLFGSLQAEDAKTGTPERNLSFRSSLSEISAQMELNFMRLYNEKGHNFFTPYIFLGVGIFSFNPQAKLNVHWYDLQPLGTEGQGLRGTDPITGITYDQEPYKLTNVAIPFGLGARFNFLKYYSAGLEWGFRKTFTNYIDDVGGQYVRRDFFLETGDRTLIADLSDRSNTLQDGGNQRANNLKTKDWYSFVLVSFTFKLNYSKNCLASAGNPSYNKTKKAKR